ncbi:hypothetical protein E4U54_001458 [Claviceps lovelessii]|nr:hypothetical protein E4U54_001458 [Claviceps lovelessii]
MDRWDPAFVAFVKPLAACRAVVLTDNSGVGQSQATGEAAKTSAGWAENDIHMIGSARDISS